MKCEYIKKETLLTSPWTGGNTTELYIFPKTAGFKQGNFLFRLSTATVVAEETTFTQLPSVMRTLMVLEGELLLVHEGYYSKRIKPFEQDAFSADWLTRSYGKATDFNLMTTGKTSGNLSVLSLIENETLTLTLTTKALLIYIYKGSVAFQDILLEGGDILAFMDGIAELALLKAKTTAVLIQAEVALQE